MSKVPAGTEVLSLTPAQEMIYFMLKYSFFHKQVIQIPAAIVVERKFDVDLMKKAIAKEIERNDSMRLRFFKQGGKVKQYFVDKADFVNIRVMTFATEKEQEDYLNADAGRAIRCFTDEIYRFILFTGADGRQGIYINVSHLAMDAAAVFVFFADLLAVYDALENGTEMPKPLGSFRKVIDKENAWYADKEKVGKEHDFYKQLFIGNGEPIYNGVHGPALLESLRKKKKNPELRVTSCFDPIHDEAVLTKKPLRPEDSKIITDFMDESGLSPECIVQLGMRLHVAKLNESVNNGIIDTYFVTLCTRRKTMNEKRCGGSMTCTLPWRTVLDRDLTFRQGIEQLQDLQHLIFRHQDYPFIDWRNLENEVYHYSMANATSSMMFSWFPLEKDTMNGWDYEFKGYNLGRYVMPLYSYAFRDGKTGMLRFAFLYRTNLISEENIDALASRTVKALKMGCSNPDMTLGEIYDLL